MTMQNLRRDRVLRGVCPYRNGSTWTTRSCMSHSRLERWQSIDELMNAQRPKAEQDAQIDSLPRIHSSSRRTDTHFGKGLSRSLPWTEGSRWQMVL